LIEKILAGISADYRALLTLRESEGLSYGEIAGILRCSVNAVKSRLARARQALRNRTQYFLASPDVHISTERQTVP
jgi:RNA polymerase sigma-70 factor (ECF subfamily)